MTSSGVKLVSLVKPAVVVALFAKPFTNAFALRVVVDVMAMGPVYRVDVAVGSAPFVV